MLLLQESATQDRHSMILILSLALIVTVAARHCILHVLHLLRIQHFAFYPLVLQHLFNRLCNCQICILRNAHHSSGMYLIFLDLLMVMLMKTCPSGSLLYDLLGAGDCYRPPGSPVIDT